jgi:5-formyltetrahydrofolate cyclo-ligase
MSKDLTLQTVALALREQVLEGNAVPIGDQDWTMDMIVTPDGVLTAEK